MKITIRPAFGGDVFELDAEQTWTLAHLERALPLHLRSDATRAITWMLRDKVIRSDPHALLTNLGIEENAVIDLVRSQRSFIVTTHGRGAEVRDAATGECCLTLAGHEAAVFSAAYSRDGASIVTASADGSAKVWDAATGVCRLTIAASGFIVLSAAYSPDGASIVTAAFYDAAKVWDAATGKCRSTVLPNVISAAFQQHFTGLRLRNLKE